MPPASADLPAAVLWDMDGTLVNTEPYWMTAEREVVESFGGTWSEELALQLVGNDLLVSADFILANSPVDMDRVELVHALQTRVIEQVAHQVPWRPGAEDLLAALVAADVPCALVTMSWRALADAVVAGLPAGSFAAVITGDEVSKGKPDPEPYAVAARTLGVAPGECVAIEDSATGVRSATAAGVPTLAVPCVLPVPRIAGSVQAPSLRGLRPADLLLLVEPARTSPRQSSGKRAGSGVAPEVTRQPLLETTERFFEQSGVGE